MKILSFYLLFITVSFSSIATESFTLNKQTKIIYASVAQGQKVLSANDEFLSGLSEFDLSSRLKTDQPVSKEKYLAFVAKQVLPWQQKDIQLLNNQFAQLRQSLEQYNVHLPKQVVFIKTTGDEEGNPAGYTRANAIILTKAQLSPNNKMLKHLLLHEFFHVLSRSSPMLKDKLYAIIGFTKAQRLDFPKSLRSRKITNPDAPLNNYYITVKHQDKMQKVVPILFAKDGGYDVKKGGPFFAYLDFRLLPVEHDKSTGVMTPIAVDNQVLLYSPGKVADYFGQIGNNTSYVIHPEEVLAENFALLLAGKQGLPNPEILSQIAQALKH